MPFQLCPLNKLSNAHAPKRSIAVAESTSGRANDKDFNSKYPAIVLGLAAMPEVTVISGEIVALNESGRSRERREFYLKR